MSPESDDSWLVRRRNLIVAGVLVVAVIATALLAGKHSGGPSGDSIQVRFGPSVTPPPGKLTFTNGWVASLGHERVAVYAGSQLDHPRNGFLVDVVNVDGQPKRDATVRVAGSGALTLLRPDHFSTIQAAGQATLHFVTANGGTGTLNVSSDKVALSG